MTNIGNESDIDKIRKILVEPALREFMPRVSRIEEAVNKIDPNATSSLKFDIDAMRHDVDALKREITSVKGTVDNIIKEIKDLQVMMVGFNKKITGAFSAFINPGQK